MGRPSGAAGSRLLGLAAPLAVVVALVHGPAPDGAVVARPPRVVAGVATVRAPSAARAGPGTGTLSTAREAIVSSPPADPGAGRDASEQGVAGWRSGDSEDAGSSDRAEALARWTTEPSDNRPAAGSPVPAGRADRPSAGTRGDDGARSPGRPGAERRGGQWPVLCTEEIDDVAQLRDIVLSAAPDEIICVRGPRPRPAALAAVCFARSQLGVPYRWGGTGRQDGGFDCSGLTSASYAAAGIPLPRTAQAQYDAGPRLGPDQPIQTGDLVFFGSGPHGVGHVGLAVSADQMINAPRPGQVVSVGPIRRRDFVGATRPVDHDDAHPGRGAVEGR